LTSDKNKKLLFMQTNKHTKVIKWRKAMGLQYIAIKARGMIHISNKGQLFCPPL